MDGKEEQLREFLRWAVANFSKDRRAVANIRWFSDNQPEILISVGVEMLLDSDDTPGIRYLTVQLLKHPAFFQVITDPWRYTIPQAVKIGRRLLSVDRTVDIKLARCLPARNGNAGACVLEGPLAQRALDILDEISVGRRVVPVLNHLTRHPDLSISSKSTLLVGKRVQNLNWVVGLMKEDVDPRVRANAIEAFWGADSKPVIQLFRKSLQDKNNRVVGNSIMGLHLAGDAELPAIVDKFANDYKPEFRMSTAWVMGKIGDPAFAATLGNLLKDNHPAVRSAALRSLKELRQLEVRLKSEPEETPAELQPADLEETDVPDKDLAEIEAELLAEIPEPETGEDSDALISVGSSGISAARLKESPRKDVRWRY